MVLINIRFRNYCQIQKIEQPKNNILLLRCNEDIFVELHFIKKFTQNNVLHIVKKIFHVDFFSPSKIKRATKIFRCLLLLDHHHSHHYMVQNLQQTSCKYNLSMLISFYLLCCILIVCPFINSFLPSFIPILVFKLMLLQYHRKYFQIMILHVYSIQERTYM